MCHVFFYFLPLSFSRLICITCFTQTSNHTSTQLLNQHTISLKTQPDLEHSCLNKTLKNQFTHLLLAGLITVIVYLQVSVTKTVEHITPVLRSLHWLPVIYTIDFKMILLTYKALNGLGPQYMSDMLLCYEPPRALRSSGAYSLFPGSEPNTPKLLLVFMLPTNGTHLQKP